MNLSNRLRSAVNLFFSIQFLMYFAFVLNGFFILTNDVVPSSLPRTSGSPFLSKTFDTFYVSYSISTTLLPKCTSNNASPFFSNCRVSKEFHPFVGRKDGILSILGHLRRM